MLGSSVLKKKKKKSHFSPDKQFDCILTSYGSSFTTNSQFKESFTYMGKQQWLSTEKFSI